MHVILFFTTGVSLLTWHTIGSIDREIAIYERLIDAGNEVTFVTYGSESDGRYADQYSSINILYNRWSIPTNIYAYVLPFLYSRSFKSAHVFKSNQTKGAEVALRAANLWKKPLIARCGYMWSDLATNSGKQKEAIQALSVEQKVFTQADEIEVTTTGMRDYVIKQHHINSEKINIVPNFVLTDEFKPKEYALESNRVCFVGRLSEEKNPMALVEACSNLNVELIMVGDGPLRSQIIRKSKELSTQTRLLGNVNHLRLPAILRRCSLFLLVSPHEGQPKTLLEAMSCGLPVVGADSPGIRELIRHGETGWLVSSDPAEIRDAINYLLARPNLCQQMGKNAREFIVENFSLQRVIELELSVIQKAVG